jgi:hypothetical protein
MTPPNPSPNHTRDESTTPPTPSYRGGVGVGGSRLPIPLGGGRHRPADIFERMAYWPRWGEQADDMPDDCHDDCGPADFINIYYPYRWHNGLAHYRCTRGHQWTCGWGHSRSGEAPENSGKAQVERADLDPRFATHRPGRV